MMRPALGPVCVLASAAAIFVAGAAQAAVAKTNCVRGGDARVIEVISPGEVGQSCDVRYTRSGGNVSVPYHANNSDSFCLEKARAIVVRLSSAGFACIAAKPDLRAEAAPLPEAAAPQARVAGPAVSDYIVEAQAAPAQAASMQAVKTEPREKASTAQKPVTQNSALVIPSPSSAALAAAAPSVSSAPAEPAAPLEANFSTPPHSIARAAAPSSQPVVDSALEDEMNKILTQPPAGQEASGAPAQLIEHRTQTAHVRAQPSIVGRIVGADPATPRAATSITMASMEKVVEETPAPVEASPSKNLTPAPASASGQTAGGKSQLRTPREIIKATLHAQAAAWNEGDLDAFMATYWKDDDLKFVSGATITKGWSATLKRYRDKYAGGGGLGRLGFDKMDVKMITDEVAVVTGRFNLAREGAASSGVFSLVMRRDNGAWRIVHDHTSGDPSAE